MRIRFNSQLPTQSLDLNLTARLIEPSGDVSGTPAVASAMANVPNAPGLYEIDVTVPPGDYYVTIVDDTGSYQTAMFLRIFSDGSHNLVDSIDNFDREATPRENATAVDAELNDDFATLDRPKVS